MTYTTWRRQLAYSESLALRALVRTHGRLPTIAPTVVNYREFNGHQGGASTHDIECGSERGYKRHRRRKEDACTDCKAAHCEYVKDRTARAA